ncbi:ceramidase domain-containing protein [Kangiella koreensis]|uniref:Alkaline phytoceramidase n=1 Tax=Kangiella koreensis (strain DSM 16069 / JCM 12317 / KCTC 12182 / SW-125) TaxID=523791 RepID=C7RB11_KANKD|nr:ceramidase domain-containing protein [Kangiella koreensis]ACV26453.1 conserved hypothetical protein [Kangiella koreensis DSM 16069]
MFDTLNKSWLLVAISILAIAGMFFVGPIAQDNQYHLFADSHQIVGISNFWNVFSNFSFVLVGLFGLWRYPRLAVADSKAGYLFLCVGVLLVGFGSAYYHAAPSNASLLWDRLPMTVAFMALFALLLSERVISSCRNLVLWVLVIFGVLAALYWSWTESLGQGDLRPYMLVQFLPIILMPLILWLFKERYLSTSLLFYAFILYFLAKACEYFDHEIYEMTQLVSGHTLKHLVASLAVLCIICAVPAKSANKSKKQSYEDA